jgi:aryl-alcohol dehydrogenase-like predicted oxidoreductase
LSHSEVTSAIVGARKPGQIVETAQAAEWELSQDELDRIENACSEFAQNVK